MLTQVLHAALLNFDTYPKNITAKYIYLFNGNSFSASFLFFSSFGKHDSVFIFKIPLSPFPDRVERPGRRVRVRRLQRWDEGADGRRGGQDGGGGDHHHRGRGHGNLRSKVEHGGQGEIVIKFKFYFCAANYCKYGSKMLQALIFEQGHGGFILAF